MDTDWFTFQARLDRLVDGDTVDLLVDLGFRTRKQVRVRAVGIDTGEVYGIDEDSDEYRHGTRHADFARTWFEENAGGEDWPFVLDTEKDTGKYGRWPGRIASKPTGGVFNEEIVNEFPAVAS